MQFKVIRKYKKEDYTIGEFYIDYEDGKGFQLFSNTLEDKVREQDSNGKVILKVQDNTAIPTGRFKVTFEYSNRFKMQMPYLNNVPGFIGILIHSGNTKEDTSGCILVGINTEKGKITSSMITFNKLYKLMMNSKQEEFYIEII
jgi:hypothetical protein